MKIAFYSHIPISFDKQGRLCIPSYMGVYVDGLSNFVKELVLIGHVERYDVTEFNYRVNSINISTINIGSKPSGPIRFFLGFFFLIGKIKKIRNCDHLIVRAPTPLSIWFNYLIPKTKLHYLLVADEKEGAYQIKRKGLQQFTLKYFLLFNNYLLEKSIKGTKSLVNSKALLKRYEKIGISTTKVTTTTLVSDDFHKRTDCCKQSPYKLLYTGRIDLAKGIIEMINAIFMLLKEGISCKLDIVGWDDNGGSSLGKINDKIYKLNLENRVIFHGKKSVGKELNEYYRKADIYLIPSYHEGFPRAIWEAIANSLPVIATRVGSIPFVLDDRKTAMLIEPKNSIDLANAIKALISDGNLRQELILNGYNLARENSIEKQTKKLVNIISRP
jgi:glycosyltransferase involved in cell wall biosynthesis